MPFPSVTLEIAIDDDADPLSVLLDVTSRLPAASCDYVAGVASVMAPFNGETNPSMSWVSVLTVQREVSPLLAPTWNAPE